MEGGFGGKSPITIEIITYIDSNAVNCRLVSIAYQEKRISKPEQYTLAQVKQIIVIQATCVNDQINYVKL